MSLILRVDVDRPYGRAPLLRHVASRVSSDLYLPRLQSLGYLRELVELLQIFNAHRSSAHIFFRRCTLPTPQVLSLMAQGSHVLGLHLENSRSRETFSDELATLESAAGRPVRAVSKHGSGGEKYGRKHYAPYEPDRYIDWCAQTGIGLFLGNLEDPTTPARTTAGGVVVFPSAFWLETAWRDTSRFSVDWLIDHAQHHDVVLLIHPENTLGSPEWRQDLLRLLKTCQAKVLA